MVVALRKERRGEAKIIGRKVSRTWWLAHCGARNGEKSRMILRVLTRGVREDNLLQQDVPPRSRGFEEWSIKKMVNSVLEITGSSAYCTAS